MKQPKTIAGKLLRGAVNTLIGTTPAGPIVQTLRGITKGAIEATPFSAFKDFLDVNQDGKIDFKDLKEMKWEDIAKLATVGAISYLAIKYGLLAL